MPEALEPASVRGKVSEGTVVAVECCYGAEHYRPDVAGGQMSLAATYLHEGASGVVGASNLAYGPEASMGSADLVTRYFLAEVHDGASLGRALLEARQRFVREHGELDPVDLKTLVQFDLLGDPSVTPVRVPLPRSAPKALQATSVGTRLRRQALARVGESLTQAWYERRRSPSGPRRRASSPPRIAPAWPRPQVDVRTYRASAAVPSRTSFHLLTDPRGAITVVREAPGEPTTARTVVRK